MASKTMNKNPNALVTSRQYDHPRGHLRPDEYEGEILRAAPYELGGDDYQSESRDFKNVPVAFRSPSGDWIEPADQPL